MVTTYTAESPLISSSDGGGNRRRSSGWLRTVFTALAVVLVVTVILGIALGVTYRPTASTPESEKRAVPNIQSLGDKHATHLQIARKILKQVPLIDGHNDLPWKLELNTNGQLSKVDLNANLSKTFNQFVQTDIPLLRKGQVGGQFWSVFTMCNTQYKDGVQKAVELIDLIKRFTHKYHAFLKFVTSPDEIMAAHQNNHLASLIGVEGGHMMGNSLSVLRMLYDLGARYMTLTWNCNTPWADNNQPETDKRTEMKGGISKWGEIVIKEMNRLGMLVDLSHVSHDTMRDVIKVTRAPVIFSHSSAYSLCPHPRNVPDDVLLSMKKNNGIVMVNFSNKFINCTLSNRLRSDHRTASLSQVADHIEYLRGMVGPDRIGLGSDFDGGSSTYNSFPDGLENTSKYPYLVVELLKRGWPADHIRKLVGQNIIRVFREVEKIRDMSRSMDPYEEPISIDDIPDKSCITYPWNK